MGAFVISKRFNDRYKFVFTSRKGKEIFTSKSYELRFECEEDIEWFKANLEKAEFLKVKASSGKFFFKLMFGGRFFAQSRKYSTELRLQKGVDEIKRDAVRSEILNLLAGELVFSEWEEV